MWSDRHCRSAVLASSDHRQPAGRLATWLTSSANEGGGGCVDFIPSQRRRPQKSKISLSFATEHCRRFQWPARLFATTGVPRPPRTAGLMMVQPLLLLIAPSYGEVSLESAVNMMGSSFAHGRREVLQGGIFVNNEKKVSINLAKNEKKTKKKSFSSSFC